jgi:bifunctional non-homologous end joining protein LigD
VGLETYRKKRKFNVTSEPRGKVQRGSGQQYVIQKHDATRLHYDLRLELDGVMKSWAVTRGPSLDPNDKRLAVHVEDHPIEYNTFEGIIPEGEYGGGTVMIWDRGTWEPDGDPHKAYSKGHLEFTLHGKKLHGRWHLVRMRARQGDRHENWLLIKGKDEEARSARDEDILEEEPRSAATGRTMEEIAGGKGKKRVWHSNRAKGAPAGGARKGAGRQQTQREFKAQLKALGTGRAKPERKSAAPAKAAKAPKPSATKKSAAKPRARAKPAAVRVERKSGEGPRHSQRRAAGKDLPDFVPPSLATLQDSAPRGANWLHEIKFDGYRIEARLDHRQVRLLTRKQLDWTHRFAPIAQAIAALPAQTALIDGELVVEDDSGHSNFSLLQTDLKNGRSDRFVYWAFDLLYLDGVDLTGAPLTARKAALHRLLGGETRKGRVRYVEHFDGDGPTIFKSACEMKLEGIISKLREAPYRSGRTDHFLKIKCHNEQEFVVAGFSPSNAMPNAVGALTVAYHENGALRYAGRVGTGYTRDIARDLWKRLEPLRIARPALALPPDERRKNVIWVKPQVVVEAEFRGITHDGLLRQASYKGLREDKPASEVVRETPAAAAAQRQAVRKSSASKSAKSARPTKAAAAPRAGASGGRTAARSRQDGDVAGVSLTHPDRVYWADVGVTKHDLAEYYVRVWDAMAPHVVDRALAIVRCPEGVGGECFFQKHIASNIKQSSLRHVVKGKDHDVIAVENPGDVIELVQSGALEIHVRGSRLDALEACDRIVFDLDPGEGVAWKDVVAGAKEIRDRLAGLKLKTFAKLSGGKGIHVVLPIADTDWDTAKTFSGAVAAAMSADSPKLYLAKMTKALRKGKIFIDFFRNSREATSVAPYSTRAREGAPISMPLTWEALSRSQSGHQFTLPDLKKLPPKDAWAELPKVRQKLPNFSKPRR